MKKQKIHLKRLSLQKKTIAAVNVNSIQGGTIGNTTILETRLAIICQTNPTNITVAVTVFSKVETKCIECFQDKSKKEIVCNGGVTESILC